MDSIVEDAIDEAEDGEGEVHANSFVDLTVRGELTVKMIASSSIVTSLRSRSLAAGKSNSVSIGTSPRYMVKLPLYSPDLSWHFHEKCG